MVNSKPKQVHTCGRDNQSRLPYVAEWRELPPTNAFHSEMPGAYLNALVARYIRAVRYRFE